MAASEEGVKSRFHTCVWEKNEASLDVGREIGREENEDRTKKTTMAL